MADGETPRASSEGMRYSSSSNKCGKKIASISSVLILTSQLAQIVTYGSTYLNTKSPFCALFFGSSIADLPGAVTGPAVSVPA